jgi:hypothetical protein
MNNQTIEKFKRNFINGTNYKLKKYPDVDQYLIVHTPTGSNLLFSKQDNRFTINLGGNPPNARGFGIGIRLRALATALSILKNMKINHRGVFENRRQYPIPLTRNSRPASTSLLRKHLGFVPTNQKRETPKRIFYNSVYIPGNNRKDERVFNAARTNTFNENEYKRRLSKGILSRANTNQ